MKKRITHGFISLTAMLLTVFFVLTLSACSYFLSEDDVIPDKCGKAEGLWLYHENTRALSDGTQRTKLLTNIAIGGAEYSAEEFKIIRTDYATDVKEIFYVLSVGESVYAYHYNYRTQQSGYLCTLNSPNTEILVSKSYVLFTSSQDGVLFNHDLKLLSDELIGFDMPSWYYGKTSGSSGYPYEFFYYYCNFPYKKEPNHGYMNFYYFDGKEVQLLEDLYDSGIFVSGNYVYFLKYGYSLNVETNGKIQFEKYDRFSYPIFEDGIFYALAPLKDTREYKLISLHGGELEVLYDFGETTRAIEMNGLKIKVPGSREIYNKYYKIDTKTGKLVRIKKTEYNKTEELHARTIEVEGCTFYITSKKYGGSFIGALTPQKTCFYLNRKMNGKTEIMQYLLEDDLEKSTGKNYFYDDICNF